MTNTDDIRARLAAARTVVDDVDALLRANEAQWVALYERDVTALLAPHVRPASEAPHDGTKIVAWGHLTHDQRKRKRWMEVDFMGDAAGCAPYWRWTVPGFTSPVEFDWWMPRPDMAALDEKGEPKG